MVERNRKIERGRRDNLGKKFINFGEKYFLSILIRECHVTHLIIKLDSNI